MNIKGITLLQKSLSELKDCLEDIGGCDHSVGLCCCTLKYLIEDIEKYTTDWATEKCTVCSNTILRDESYIQNCDGIQHLSCYMGAPGVFGFAATK